LVSNGGGPSLKSIIQAFPDKTVQACPLRERCARVLLVLSHPPVLVRGGTTIIQGETTMQQNLKLQTVTAKRQVNSAEITSIYRAPRYRVALVCEETGESSVVIQDSTSAASLFRPHFADLDREHFLVLGLDAKRRVIGINLVSVGSLTLAIVHPREVFKPLNLDECVCMGLRP
jgi:hypothetical protein